ncbi:proline racemase family protein [Kordiimonas laminariae]|uniref:proline racemase family protein n=1 Tax=Kordiimonas laminariae TaxID=2917717 RepID=UPI001FF0F8D2|nr:proline racemase family protein [Kordiimonas laminariae]MCK0068167.1 proline racemase family protein [Kordiimonas laminariae]
MAKEISELHVQDMHTAGEPVRIITGGYPELKGNTILEKRRDALKNHDRLREITMLEPRGHADMYGVIPTAPSHPDAALAVLFTHNSGYSTMCGHATIAMGRYAIESGIVEAKEGLTEFVLECPCGPVHVKSATSEGKVSHVSFESVEGYLAERDLEVTLKNGETVTVDIAYGGAYYAFVPASRLGLDLSNSPLEDLRRAAVNLTNTIRENHAITHPKEPDLGFLYGTIITDDGPLKDGEVNPHLCYFAEGQLDRSPTGSGVTARLALAHAKGQMDPGASYKFCGISGIPFKGRIVRETTLGDQTAVITEIGGSAHYSGTATFTVEEHDPLPNGLPIPETAGAIWRA